MDDFATPGIPTRNAERALVKGAFTDTSLRDHIFWHAEHNTGIHIGNYRQRYDPRRTQEQGIYTGLQAGCATKDGISRFDKGEKKGRAEEGSATGMRPSHVGNIHRGARGL